MKWLGHACFYLTSPRGVRILTDPFDKGVPYPPVSVECDVVTVSHEHSDHAGGLGGVKGSPRVLRGVDKDSGQVRRITDEVGDVRFRTVPTDHDDQGGAKRGKNAVFVMDFAGLVVVHLGDLGHVLAETTVKDIGRCDVLLVPVGGFYTIDGKAAAEVVKSLSPRVVVPMHYKTKYTASWPISGPDEFLRGQRNVRYLDTDQVDLKANALPAEQETWVFSF